MTTADAQEAVWRAEGVIPLRPSRRLVGDRLGDRVLHALAGSGAVSRRRARSAFTAFLGLLIVALALFLVALLAPLDPAGRESPPVPTGARVAPVAEPTPVPVPAEPEAPSSNQARPEPRPEIEVPVPAPVEREPDRPAASAVPETTPPDVSPSEIITESVPLPPTIPVPKFETQEVLPAPKPVRPRTRVPEPRPRFELPTSLRPSS